MASFARTGPGALVVGLGIVIAACGGGGGGNTTPSTTAIAKASAGSGDGQTGVVGQALAQPLKVVVTDGGVAVGRRDHHLVHHCNRRRPRSGFRHDRCERQCHLGVDAGHRSGLPERDGHTERRDRVAADILGHRHAVTARSPSQRPEAMARPARSAPNWRQRCRPRRQMSSAMESPA